MNIKLMLMHYCCNVALCEQNFNFSFHQHWFKILLYRINILEIEWLWILNFANSQCAYGVRILEVFMAMEFLVLNQEYFWTLNFVDYCFLSFLFDPKLWFSTSLKLHWTEILSQSFWPCTFLWIPTLIEPVSICGSRTCCSAVGTFRSYWNDFPL